MSGSPEGALPRPASQTLALAAALTAVSLWGLAPVATRYIVLRVDPLAVLALRFSMSALAFLPALIHSRLLGWSRADIKAGITCGLVGIVGYGLPVTIGQQWTTASLTGLILASEPLWIMLIWTMLERRRPGLSTGIGTIIGLVGVAVLCGGDKTIAGNHGYLGAGLVLLSAVAWSAYCVLIGSLAARRGALPATAFTIIAGAIPFLFIGGTSAVETMGSLTPLEWAVLAGLAIGGSVFAVLLWNFSLAKLGAPKAGPFLYLVPLATVVGGIGLLNEAPGLGMLAGGAITLAGVIIAQGKWAERLAGRVLSRPQRNGRSS